MLADCDSKIALFHKEKYYHVCLALEGTEAVNDRMVSPKDAQALRNACDEQRTMCISGTREKAPRLCDLTILQRNVNRVFGYSTKQTLVYVQSFYEKKLMTSPRLTADWEQ